jgi:mannose-6-phosphate isomerase-like protein (cupin superfamily)
MPGRIQVRRGHALHRQLRAQLFPPGFRVNRKFRIEKPPSMHHIHLSIAAANLPEAWKSTVLACVGSANLKVLRMDGSAYPNETHEYPECLLVVSGKLNLSVEGKSLTLGPGEVYIVPPSVPHAVAPGSSGTLVIFDT